MIAQQFTGRLHNKHRPSTRLAA